MAKIYNNNSLNENNNLNNPIIDNKPSLYDYYLFRIFIKLFLFVGPLKIYHKKPNTIYSILLPGIISFISINFILQNYFKFYLYGKTRSVKCARSDCNTPLFKNKQDLLNNIRFHIDKIKSLNYYRFTDHKINLRRYLLETNISDITLVKPSNKKFPSNNSSINSPNDSSINSQIESDISINTPEIENDVWKSTDLIKITRNGKHLITFYNGNNPKKINNFYNYIFLCFIVTYGNISFFYNSAYFSLNKSILIQDRIFYRRR